MFSMLNIFSHQSTEMSMPAKSGLFKWTKTVVLVVKDEERTVIPELLLIMCRCDFVLHSVRKSQKKKKKNPQSEMKMGE